MSILRTYKPAILKQLILSFFVSIVSVLGSAQTKEIDSLLKQAKTSENIADKVNSYDKLSWALIDIDLEQAFAFNDSAYNISKTENYDKGVTKSLDNYIVLHRARGNYDKALEYLDTYDKLISGDTLNEAGAAFQRGVLNSITGNYDESLESYQKALNFYELLKNDRGMGITYNTIGMTYSNIERYDEAIKNFDKSIEKLINTTHINNLASTYLNLANVYDYKDEDNKALEYYNKSIVLSEKTSNIRRIALNKQNISSIYKQQKLYDKAITYAKEAYNTLKENNYEGELTGAAANLGDIYTLMGNYQKSEQILLEQLDTIKGSAADQQNLYFNLSKLYEASNQNQKALEFHKKFKKVSDKRINENGLKNLDELQIKYNTEKKDKTILKNELQLQKSHAKARLMTILIISLLLASILLWFTFQQRQKRIQQQLIAIKKEQEVLTLESLIEGEEKERLRIAKELHDGVNGDLSAIKYKLSSLLKMNNEVINEAVSMIDNSCKQVRAISHNLVPPSLKDFNLIEAINNYCDNMNGTHKAEISFQQIGDSIDLHKKVEVNIFRIIQELVTNAIKHSEAKIIDVQISNLNDTLLVTVEDNGKGYEIKDDTQTGIGLNNIKSRVEYLNANLDIITSENGTSNTIEIDLKKINDN